CRDVYTNSDRLTSRSRMSRSAHDHRSTPHGAAKTISHGAGSLLEDAVLRSFEIDARLAGPEREYTSNAKDTHREVVSHEEPIIDDGEHQQMQHDGLQHQGRHREPKRGLRIVANAAVRAHRQYEQQREHRRAAIPDGSESLQVDFSEKCRRKMHMRLCGIVEQLHERVLD